MRTILGFVLMFFTMGSAQSIGVALTRPDDRFTLEPSNTLNLYSATGIGRATLSKKGRSWPKKLWLRLRYSDGRGFGHLEGFSLKTRQLTLRGSLKGITEATDAQGQRLEAKTLSMRVEAKYLEVALPLELFKNAKQIVLEWIDFYR